MTPAPKYTDEQVKDRTDGTFVSPEVFYEELTQSAPDYLQCRGYGHSWRPHTVVTHGTRRNPSYEVSVVCGSCDAVRIDYLDKFGDPIRDSHLHYPQGYTADGSAGAMRGTRGLAKLVGVTKTGRFTRIESEED